MAPRLSFEEREEIACGLAAHESIRSIGRRLHRQPSTISREIEHHSFHRHAVTFDRPEMTYRAAHADRSAMTSRARPRPARLTHRGPLRTRVLQLLRKRFSPHQITARLLRDYPHQPEMQVSHETIYQAIYLQSRGNLRTELRHQLALRSGRARRRARPIASAATRSNRNWVGLNISQRPAEADDRAVPGHWEGDLVIGKNGTSAVATLVERSTRYLILVALPNGRLKDDVAARLATAMRRLPAQLLRSLTWDQGSEMAAHATFTLTTDCPVFFCDPHSPWQRGSNENTNGLLRQYYPKSVTNFRTITQHQLNIVAHQLNERPRKTLAWDTPTERLTELLGVATTG